MSIAGLPTEVLAALGPHLCTADLRAARSASTTAKEAFTPLLETLFSKEAPATAGPPSPLPPPKAASSSLGSGHLGLGIGIGMDMLAAGAQGTASGAQGLPMVGSDMVAQQLTAGGLDERRAGSGDAREGDAGHVSVPEFSVVDVQALQRSLGPLDAVPEADERRVLMAPEGAHVIDMAAVMMGGDAGDAGGSVDAGGVNAGPPCKGTRCGFFRKVVSGLGSLWKGACSAVGRAWRGCRGLVGEAWQLLTDAGPLLAVGGGAALALVGIYMW
jgi:hypothetical protein